MSLPTGTVTFLFTDIEGSTARYDEFPEAMARAQRRHDELVWREECRLPPPTWGELDRAVGAISSRYHVEELEAQGFLEREPGVSRGIRLTDKGRAAGRQVQYRVYTKREGGAEHSINGPRRYTERKLQERRQEHPELDHRLALSLEGGRIDWDAPEVARDGTTCRWAAARV